MENILEKRAIDLTAGELADVIIAKLKLTKQEESTIASLPPIIHGIDGLAKFLECSYQTAYKYRNDKRFDCAFKQEGNSILIDTQKFLSIYGSKKGGRR